MELVDDEVFLGRGAEGGALPLVGERVDDVGVVVVGGVEAAGAGVGVPVVVLEVVLVLLGGLGAGDEGDEVLADLGHGGGAPVVELAADGAGGAVGRPDLEDHAAGDGGGADGGVVEGGEVEGEVGVGGGVVGEPGAGEVVGVRRRR
jgi:hypothetical protein